MSPVIAIITLFTLILGSLLFLRRPGRQKKDPSESQAPPVQQEKKNPNAKPRAPRELTGEERDQMLDGMRALARENPERVAGVVRKWMKEE